MEPCPLRADDRPRFRGSFHSKEQPSLVRGLGLLDSVLLLVSGIIGSSIFLTAKDIAGPLPQPILFLLVWVLGALISLCACFAFAELGSMYPDSGGQYIYPARGLRRSRRVSLRMDVVLPWPMAARSPRSRWPRRHIWDKSFRSFRRNTSFSHSWEWL